MPSLLWRQSATCGIQVSFPAGAGRVTRVDRLRPALASRRDSAGDNVLQSGLCIGPGSGPMSHLETFKNSKADFSPAQWVECTLPDPLQVAQQDLWLGVRGSVIHGCRPYSPQMVKIQSLPGAVCGFKREERGTRNPLFGAKTSSGDVRELREVGQMQRDIGRRGVCAEGDVSGVAKGLVPGVGMGLLLELWERGLEFSHAMGQLLRALGSITMRQSSLHCAFL